MVVIGARGGGHKISAAAEPSSDGGGFASWAFQGRALTLTDSNYKGALFSERVIANHAIRPLHLPVFG